MSTALSNEAEQAIVRHNLQVSSTSRKVLSSMNDDPDRQTKYVVNPVVQYTMEASLNQWFENFKHYVNQERGLVTPAPTTVKDTAPVVEAAKSDDDDDEGTFSLFD